MIAEINLLPEKPKKNYLIISFVGAAIAVSLLLLAGGFIYYNSLQTQLIQVEKNTENVIQLQDIALNNLSLENELPSLDRSVSWLEEQQFPSTALLESLISQLPLSGAFINYNYTDIGTIELSVSFGNQDDISSYLYHMNELSFVTNAKINNIHIQESDTDNKYVASFFIQYNVDKAKLVEEEDVG